MKQNHFRLKTQQQTLEILHKPPKLQLQQQKMEMSGHEIASPSNELPANSKKISIPQQFQMPKPYVFPKRKI